MQQACVVINGKKCVCLCEGVGGWSSLETEPRDQSKLTGSDVTHDCVSREGWQKNIEGLLNL